MNRRVLEAAAAAAELDRHPSRASDSGGADGGGACAAEEMSFRTAGEKFGRMVRATADAVSGGQGGSMAVPVLAAHGGDGSAADGTVKRLFVSSDVFISAAIWLAMAPRSS